MFACQYLWACHGFKWVLVQVSVCAQVSSVVDMGQQLHVVSTLLDALPPSYYWSSMPTPVSSAWHPAHL
jgi:hypothetical protein